MIYSPLFGNDFALATKSPSEREYRRLARRTPVIAELLDTLIGAAAGSTALNSYARVEAGNEDDGGPRPIETRSRINRASTAGDVTALKAMLSTGSRLTMPVDGAGVWGA